MKIDQVRKLTPQDLTKEIDKIRLKVVELRTEIAMHRIKNWRSLSAAKQYLARLLTIQTEREIIKASTNE